MASKLDAKTTALRGSLEKLKAAIIDLAVESGTTRGRLASDLPRLQSKAQAAAGTPDAGAAYDQLARKQVSICQHIGTYNKLVATHISCRADVIARIAEVEKHLSDYNPEVTKNRKLMDDARIAAREKKKKAAGGLVAAARGIVDGEKTLAGKTI